MPRSTRRQTSSRRTQRKTTKDRKPYESPRLTTYGDLARLTQGGAGPARDGGSGAPKSKPAGGA